MATTGDITRRTLGRAGIIDYLNGLTETFTDIAGSLYLPPGLPKAEVAAMISGHFNRFDALGDIAAKAAASPTGAAMFFGPEFFSMVLPPFPLPDKKYETGLEIDTLASVIEKDYLIGLVLVRLGSYAVGVCRGEKLLSSKVGTGLVHGRHRQGGSSAHRFERHRDKQIEYFLTRVCRHAREHLEPLLKELNYIVYGGARTTILLLQKQCHFLGRLTTPGLPPLLDIAEPRRAVLESSVGRVWSSTVFEWRAD